MRRIRINTVWGKRAVRSGLFLGVLFCLTGCVKPVVQPEITATPEPTLTSGAVPTPEPTDTPTPVPQKTEEPQGSPTPTIVPSATPTASLTPTEGATDAPTPVPVSTTPEPTTTPEPDNTPVAEPTMVPEVPVTATPLPIPTAFPEYETLLQNGWQRTEDFFGCREIFFSGKFDVTQLYAVPGRYEYRYTASSDAGISFSVIGEELPVQLFLDELTETAECLIVTEGEKDYSYVYTDEDGTVQGRIYACENGDRENRMRVEFRSIAEQEAATEGYGFYLR